MAYRLLGSTIRTSAAAKAALRLRLYYLYRGLLVKLGYQNPFAAVLKVTSSCNLSCIHCPWDLKGRKDVPTENWLEIIDAMYGLGCEVVIFEGGEPTLRGDLGRLIDYVRSKNILAVIVTNGTIDVSGLHPDAFWFSIEGTRSIHDSIRGDGVFAQAVDNMMKNRDKHRIVAVTLFRKNAGEAESICEAFEPIADGIWFNFLYPYKNIAAAPLTMQQAAATAEAIMTLKRRYSKIINSDAYLATVGRKTACYPWWTVNVMPDGTVTHGCTVEQIEACRCEACSLTCYGEPFMALNLRGEALACLRKSSGIREKHLLLHK